MACRFASCAGKGAALSSAPEARFPLPGTRATRADVPRLTDGDRPGALRARQRTESGGQARRSRTIYQPALIDDQRRRRATVRRTSPESSKRRAAHFEVSSAVKGRGSRPIANSLPQVLRSRPVVPMDESRCPRPGRLRPRRNRAADCLMVQIAARPAPDRADDRCWRAPWSSQASPAGRADP